MPTIHSISVLIHNQKPVYRPGDEIKGQWTVSTGETFSVKSVSISLHGAVFTRWENEARKADDNKGYECITSQERVVFPENRSGATVDYPAGKYVYKFSFRLPREMIPSSYEGKHGAIRYWLSFDIERPLLRMHIDRIKVLTVLADIDVNLPQYSKFVGRKSEKVVSKALGFGNQGTVSLTAQTDRGAYCPGEKIYIKYIAENKSEKDFGRIRIDLMQKVRFRASGTEKYKYLCLKTTFAEEVKKGVKLQSVDNKYALTIPAVPPTTMERTSHIIKVMYYVKVLIDIPKINGGDAIVIIPIILGTIPQGHRSRPEAEVTGASNISVIDASSAITYTQCVDGFEDGSMIYEDEKFPRFTYIPWCTYVPDFKPITKPPVTKTAQTPANAPKQAPKQVNAPTVDANKTNLPTKQEPAPLDTKQPLPTVQAPLQPSAPPVMPLHPPSYEDVMREMEAIPVQQPEENSGNEAEETEENSAQSDTRSEAGSPVQQSGVMIIRFSDSCLKQFRDALRVSGASLTKLDGKVIAVSPQVIVTKGAWPKQTSIAVLIFDAFDNGPLWFNIFKQECNNNAVEIKDCSMLKGRNEEYKNGKSLFSMNLSTVKEFNSKEYIDMLNTIGKVLKPVRLEHGGVSISSSKVTAHLADEHVDDYHISLSQWDSVKQMDDYKTFVKDEKFKDAILLYSKFFKAETTAIFQAEDMSYLIEVENGES